MVFKRHQYAPTIINIIKPSWTRIGSHTKRYRGKSWKRERASRLSLLSRNYIQSYCEERLDSRAGTSQLVYGASANHLHSFCTENNEYLTKGIISQGRNVPSYKPSPQYEDNQTLWTIQTYVPVRQRWQRRVAPGGCCRKYHVSVVLSSQEPAHMSAIKATQHNWQCMTDPSSIYHCPCQIENRHQCHPIDTHSLVLHRPTVQ